MGAIAIRCPECGATIPADASAQVATCEYCGTRSQVRRRTAFFEIPQPPPTRQEPELANLPVALQRHSARWTASLFLIPLFIGGMIAISVFAQREAMKGPASLRTPTWDGVHSAVMVDVDDDGTVDLIGRAAILQPEHRTLLGAWHGTTGERLWITEPLGLRSDLFQAPLGVAGDLVLLGDGAGGVLAFAVADGTPRWTIRLNEKVEKFCAGPEGSVLARTADDKLHPIALADGAIQPAGEGAACVPVPTDSYRGDRTGWEVWTWPSSNSDLAPGDKIDGMTAGTALHHRTSGVTVALGYKAPGSRVPMLASFRWPVEEEFDLEALERRARETDDAREGGELRRRVRDARSARSEWVPEVHWTAQVPGIDPLTAAEGAVEAAHAALDGELVVVAYETRSSGQFRLAGFAVADGRRLWDVALAGDRSVTTIDLSPTHALVSNWDGLRAFDRATGNLAFTIE
jgi:DNA-directed RNA polymerase subunit RPC12/RpoP